MAVLSTPQWWFNNIVVPNYNEFSHDQLCQRRAFNALVTTYHMWERLYWYYSDTRSRHLHGMSKDQFLGHLKSPSQCPLLEQLGMAANSAKHSLRISKGKSPSFLEGYTATGQVKSKPTPAGDVLVMPGDRPVKDVLETVMEFWKTWLRDHPDP